MSAAAAEPFEEFAKVELFGHQVLVARVTKSEIGDFVRCDVLDAKGKVAFTKLVNPKAIYAINLIDKKAAFALAKVRAAEPPVQRFELPALMAGTEADE
ncbi:MAG: hypothetical protein HZA93_23670 [Verrucomicrobia bacterium]|nr:hypothetical protein [Verrucomicrobiota bacterium]